MNDGDRVPDDSEPTDDASGDGGPSASEASMCARSDAPDLVEPQFKGGEVRAER